MQMKHPPPTSSPSGAAAVQDGADDTNALLSALADGELSDHELEQLMQHLQHADQFAAEPGQATHPYQVWEQYQIVGQCLRAPQQHHAARDSHAFLHAFRERLAVEKMQSVPQSSVSEFLQSAPALTQVESAGQDRAANASVFRWKMVAGFASLAAVAAIGWNTVGNLSGSSQGQGMQLASTAQETPVVTAAAQETAPVVTAVAAAMPSPNVVAVANRAAAPTFNRDGQGVTGIVIRDPKLDEILNRQYGSTVAMQPPAPFLRNASANSGIGH